MCMHTGMLSFSGLVVLSEKSRIYAAHTVQEMHVILVDVNFEQAPGLCCLVLNSKLLYQSAF